MKTGSKRSLHRRFTATTPARYRTINTRAHVRPRGPRIGLGRHHRMNLSLWKCRRHYPTSIRSSSLQIIPITCHQITRIPTLCPTDTQDTTSLAYFRVLSSVRDVRPYLILTSTAYQPAEEVPTGNVLSLSSSARPMKTVDGIGTSQEISTTRTFCHNGSAPHFQENTLRSMSR